MIGASTAAGRDASIGSGQSGLRSLSLRMRAIGAERIQRIQTRTQAGFEVGGVDHVVQVRGRGADADRWAC